MALGDILMRVTIQATELSLKIDFSRHRLQKGSKNWPSNQLKTNAFDISKAIKPAGRQKGTKLDTNLINCYNCYLSKR